MAIKKFMIDLHPTIKDYEYIYIWMKVAFDKNLPNSGLFHNLNKEAFDEGRVIVYRHKDNAEAFVTYRICDKVLTLYIMALNPQYHHQGIGTSFLTNVLNHFQKKGYIIADFYEPTLKGLRLVKRLGAIKKENPYNPNEFMYLKLFPSRKQNWTAKRRLVMWKDELQDDQKPDCSWSLNFTRDKKPILAYAFYDWILGIIQNGECIYKEKVKRFKGLDCYPSDYIYITSDTFIKQ